MDNFWHTMSRNSQLLNAFLTSHLELSVLCNNNNNNNNRISIPPSVVTSEAVVYYDSGNDISMHFTHLCYVATHAILQILYLNYKTVLLK